MPPFVWRVRSADGDAATNKARRALRPPFAHGLRIIGGESVEEGPARLKKRNSSRNFPMRTGYSWQYNVFGTDGTSPHHRRHQRRGRSRSHGHHHASREPSIKLNGRSVRAHNEARYACVSPLPDAAAVMRQLPAWFEHYNTVHPHRALSYH